MSSKTRNGSSWWTGVGRCLLVMSSLAAASLPAGAMGTIHEPPDREGTRLRGRSVVTVGVPPGVPVQDYTNATYRLRVVSPSAEGGGTLVEVTVDLEGAGSLRSVASAQHGGSSLSAPMDRSTVEPSSVDPSILELAEALAVGTRTAEDRAAAAVSWVRRNIRYRLDREASQDPASVLARRSAYCTGMAAVTVDLLRALGIPAREVAGYSLESPGEGPAGYHRWVELRLPGTGWRFADPQGSFGFVPATFVRLADERVPAGDPVVWRLRTKAGGLTPVTSDPRFPAGFGSVWRGPSSYGGQVTVHLPRDRDSGDDSDPWKVRLAGGWIQERRSSGGEVVFVDLAPGEYELTVEPPGAPARDPVSVAVTHGRSVEVFLPR